MVRFSDYKKYYDGNLVLEIPALELGHNIYWLQGQNGAGKTTLIKSIAGLLPFDGSISVNSADINKERIAYRSAVNYAEAEPLYPVFLTGSDIIRFYASTKKADEKQVKTLMDAFGINEYAGNKIGTYSSGMVKKLSLVLGFIGNPSLIMLDEPLITLDQKSVKNLQDLIERYFTAGVTFLITSHQEINLPNVKATRLALENKTLTITNG